MEQLEGGWCIQQPIFLYVCKKKRRSSKTPSPFAKHPADITSSEVMTVTVTFATRLHLKCEHCLLRHAPWVFCYVKFDVWITIRALTSNFSPSISKCMQITVFAEDYDFFINIFFCFEQIYLKLSICYWMPCKHISWFANLFILKCANDGTPFSNNFESSGRVRFCYGKCCKWQVLHSWKIMCYIVNCSAINAMIVCKVTEKEL